MTAVTGVRAHQTMLDVTGNNIANANTTGFKKDNTVFADLMYQASKYASGSGGSRGGINPAQVGLGVSVSAIETIHTQGSGSYTGNNSDMMIQDKGFFVYQDGNQQLYSRSGACALDENGDMVMSGQGYKLQGYKMDLQPATGEYDQAADLSTVNIPLGQKIDAKKTTRVDYQCNLDSRSKAYLSYGFADIPFNVVAGADGLSEGRAKVSMNGTDYDMAFITDFSAKPNGSGTDSTGVNYLEFKISNGGETANLVFDMIGIDGENGKPKLNLPKLIDPIDVTTGLPTGNPAIPSATPSADGSTATGCLVGWLDLSKMNDPANAIYDGSVPYPTESQDQLDKNLVPIYRLPGQVPPQYCIAQYDDNTGTLKLRNISLKDASNATLTSTVGNTLLQDITGGIANFDHLVIEPSSFTYNVKDSMNYNSFAISGSPTIATLDDAGNAVYQPAPVSYQFIAEFDESVDRDNKEMSELGKTTSTVTLWYYGYSNDDAINNQQAVAEGTYPKSMHKLQAKVAFNPDGTFDYVEWLDTDNNNAPMGYRIVEGPDLNGNTVGPNFQIAVGSSSAASTAKNTLNFMQAQSLDSPGAVDNIGVWTLVGSESQGGYHTTKCTIYDDDGKTHTLEVTFKKISENRWRWEAFLVDQDESGQDVLVNIIPDPRTGEIEFDGSGRISNAISDGGLRRGDGQSIPNAEVEITVPFSLNGQPNSTITLNFGGGVGSGGSSLDGVTQFASETTTKPIYQDGYTMGILKTYSIATDGTITGSYDNGLNIPLYRVALATFSNEQGLEKVGNTMFKATVNSGNPNIDGAMSNGKGSIMSQYVEMSNVDLTEEFTHLIIAQRGFQANARTVTVSDQILEEVVNLKR